MILPARSCLATAGPPSQTKHQSLATGLSLCSKFGDDIENLFCRYITWIAETIFKTRCVWVAASGTQIQTWLTWSLTKYAAKQHTLKVPILFLYAFRPTCFYSNGCICSMFGIDWAGNNAYPLLQIILRKIHVIKYRLKVWTLVRSLVLQVTQYLTLQS